MLDVSERPQPHGSQDPLAREERERHPPKTTTDARRARVGAIKQTASAPTELAEAQEVDAILECLESDQYLTARELRAIRAADKQGLVLRKSQIRCSSGTDPCRYDLVYARYDQLAASNLELTAIEAWIGTRSSL